MYEMRPIVGSRAFDFDCPSDKSMTHRAIIFSALAEGSSKVFNPLLGEDCLSTLNIFKGLGVKASIKEEGGESYIEITSPGQENFKSPTKPLDCGNSGTTARLLIGLFSSLPSLKVEMFGDESLTGRPMGRVVNPMRDLGAKIQYLKKDGYFPIQIEGTSLKYKQSIQINKASAQIKSCITLGLMNSKQPFEISLPKGTRNHTEVILKNLGASIEVSEDSGVELIKMKPPFRPKATDFRISGDPSSAAFFMAYAGIRPGSVVKINHVLKNHTRNGFLEASKRMGLEVSESPSAKSYMEETVDLCCKAPDRLKPVVVTKDEVPTLIDELPILSVMALFADGESHFQGVEELRVKESDRLDAIVRLVSSVGGSCRVDGDDLYIQGPVGAFDGFQYDPKFDHRLFMAAAVLGSMAQTPSFIKDRECVDVSFPGFFDLLDSLR